MTEKERVRKLLEFRDKSIKQQTQEALSILERDYRDTANYNYIMKLEISYLSYDGSETTFNFFAESLGEIRPSHREITLNKVMLKDWEHHTQRWFK